MVLSLGRVAVTGSSGMVGRHVLALLDRMGTAAVATSRRPPQAPAPRNTVWRAWDMKEWRDPAELDDMFGAVDGLLHIGASVPNAGETVSADVMFDANVRACLALSSWACERNIPLVYLSGAIVYADQDARRITEDGPRARHPAGGIYGFTKLMAELVFERFEALGLRVAILRASSIYGAGLAPGKMATSFLDICRRGDVIELSPPVGDRINFINAADVAVAMVDALRHEAWGIFNIAGTVTPTVKDIADACVSACGRGSVRVSGAMAHTDPSWRYDLDCRKARDAFGFSPDVDLSEGFTRMIEGRVI